MSTDSGSGRTPAGQFSNQVVNGITSSDTRPEGQTRKYWPKQDDAVQLWLTLWRDKYDDDSPEWVVLNAMIISYIIKAMSRYDILEGN